MLHKSPGVAYWVRSPAGTLPVQSATSHTNQQLPQTADTIPDSSARGTNEGSGFQTAQQTVSAAPQPSASDPAVLLEDFTNPPPVSGQQREQAVPSRKVPWALAPPKNDLPRPHSASSGTLMQLSQSTFQTSISRLLERHELPKAFLHLNPYITHT